MFKCLRLELEASKVLSVDDVMLAMSICYIQSRLKTLG